MNKRFARLVQFIANLAITNLRVVITNLHLVITNVPVIVTNVRLAITNLWVRTSTRAKPDAVPAGPASRSRSRLRAWGILAGVLALVLGGAATTWRLTSAAADPVYTTVAAGHGAVTRTVTATGTVNPVETVIVGTYVSGVIQQVSCDFNTVVKKGQLCAKIDPRPFQTALQQDSANLEAAKAQLTKDNADLAYAKLTYDRATQLLQSKNASQDVVDNARAAYNKAQAQVDVDKAMIDQRQAAVDAAKVNLSYTDIVSPIDGVVISRNVTPGQTVAASLQTPTLFLIAADLGQMTVDANVSETDIGNLKVGQPAAFTVDAYPRRVFRGAVSQVRLSPQTVQNVVTYDVIVSLGNPDLALVPGMTAAVDFIIDQRSEVLRVPDQALRYTPGGLARLAGADGARVPVAGGARRTGNPDRQAQVWVLRDGRPSPAPVTTGLDDGKYTEIVAGDLKDGDQVIVSEGGSPGAAGGAGRPSLPIPRF